VRWVGSRPPCYHVRMARITPGGAAWLGLTAYVVGYDGFAVATRRDTMSTAFSSAVRHPRKRWPVVLAWGFITGHLFGFFGKYDPLRALPSIIKRSVDADNSLLDDHLDVK